MKRIILLFLLCFLLKAVSSDAQLYQPMAVEGATWTTYGYGDFAYNVWAYRIEGDTIIDAIYYKKLYHFEIQILDLYEVSEYRVDTTTLVGFIRDDFAERKVYLKPAQDTSNFYDYFDSTPGPHLSTDCNGSFLSAIDSTTEVLLFDFDKTVGESLDDCMLDIYRLDTLPTVITLDTLREEHGSMRRVLEFNNEFASNYLIEGLGYDMGLLNLANPYIHAGKGYYFDYCVGSQWECKLYTSSKDLNIENNFSVYPNPTQNEFTIETNRLRLDQVCIYDITGQRLSCQANGKVDVSGLPAGTYLVEIWAKGRGRWTEKVVVY